MITRRDDQGRIARGYEHPLEHLLPSPSLRDGRSGKAQEKDQTHLSVRVPKLVMERLRSRAQIDKVSVSFLVNWAISEVLQLVPQRDSNLLTDSPSERKFLGSNAKLSRLVPDSQKDSGNSVPFYDHVARNAQKKGGKPPPSLVDKGRR